MTTGAWARSRRETSRQRGLVLGAGAAVLVLAWLLLVAAHRDDHPGLPWHPQSHQLGPAGWLLVVLMWQAMMVAMMLPVVMPWLGLVTVTHATEGGRSARPVTAFACGYFAAWLLYSIGAGTLQVLLQRAMLIDGRQRLISPLSGLLLVVAGLFQFTPVKQACLTHCRSPLSYLLAKWRDRPPGAFRLGLGHGVYCVGCCWALMAVMFALGLMNVVWMAAVTLGVVLEQLAPGGERWVHILGGVLVGWGVVLLAG